MGSLSGSQTCACQYDRSYPNPGLDCKAFFRVSNLFQNQYLGLAVYNLFFRVPEILKQLQFYLEEGTLTHQFVLKQRVKLFECLRAANSTLRCALFFLKETNISGGNWNRRFFRSWIFNIWRLGGWCYTQERAWRRSLMLTARMLTKVCPSLLAQDFLPFFRSNPSSPTQYCPIWVQTEKHRPSYPRHP